MYKKYLNTYRSYMFLAKTSPQPDKAIKTRAKHVTLGMMIQNPKHSELHSYITG